MTSTKISRRLSGVAAFLAGPTLLFGLAACAPTTGVGLQDPASSSNAGEMTRAQWQLKYAECMRGEGIDMPDPDVNGSVSVGGGGPDPAALQVAADKCRTELGSPPAVTAEEQESADQQFLQWGREIAECYRENGYDMPDPKAGEELQLPSDAPGTVVEQCGAGAATVSGSVDQ